MPHDEDRVRDIVISARFIASWTDEKEMSALEDRMVLSAIVRELAIIGEACNKLSAEFRTRFPDVEWAEIIRMRNILIHSYNRVNNTIVWQAATADVPRLVATLMPDDAATGEASGPR